MKQKIIETIFTNIRIGVDNGIGHLYTEDAVYEGTKITVNGKPLINFGSYSYLCLEQDKRLKEAAKMAIDNYGLQFGSSRTYMSTTLYLELENLMDVLFEAHTVLVPTTTLGHIAVMPIVIEEGDFIIFDQNVHSSVQFMIQHLELYGIQNVMIRHNDMQSLELEILKNTSKYKKIWYLADSVYSMYGDVAPLDDINLLLEKYKNFNLYIDDAHGMSWSGKHGAGYTLSKIKLTHKTIIATSLNKAFAAGGSAFLFKDESLKTKVKTCGGPLIFSGQHLTAALGASIACAKIHLSAEIYEMQEKFQENIQICREELRKRNLPDMSAEHTPIFFIGVGLPKVGYNLIKRLHKEGFHTNLAIFPAVHTNRTGIRISINTQHSKKEIIDLIEAIDHHLYESLEEEGRTVHDIEMYFKKVKAFQATKKTTETVLKPTTVDSFTIKRFSGISEIPEIDKNIIFKNYLLSPRVLLDLENAFSGNKLKEDNWEFVYVIAYENGSPYFFTFFTTVLLKDDITASRIQSKSIENKRTTDPYYLCSYNLIMGTPITFGNHVWKWTTRSLSEIQEAQILDYLQEIAESFEVNSVIFRDMGSLGFKNSTLQGMGYIENEGMSSFVIENVQEFDFYETLKSKHRYFVRKRALEKEHLFAVQFGKNITPEELEDVFQLYCNTQKRNLELNTFPYHFSIFEKANCDRHSDWDMIRLYSRKEGKLVGVAISMIHNHSYHFLIAGLAYPDHVKLDTYSQLLLQIVKRAKTKGCSYVHLGYTTKQNKMKFGAMERRNSAFSKFKDSYKQTQIVNELQKHRTS